MINASYKICDQLTMHFRSFTILADAYSES